MARGGRASGSLSLDEARRIALAAQGFDRPQPEGRVDVRHVRRTIRQLGLVQVDYVNVLVPAHYLVLFSRLGPHDRSRLDRVVYRDHEFVEQWLHERSIVPVESWPLLRHRREEFRLRPWGFEEFLEKNAEYGEWVLEEIRRRGPLTGDDLDDPEEVPPRWTDGWGWGARVKTQVLEAHFARGRLAVAERKANFQKAYDLVERIVPGEHLERTVDAEEAERALLMQAARFLGVGTAADLAEVHRTSIRDTRRRLGRLVEEGEIREVEVEGWGEPAYLHPETRTPRSIEARALLSPFDPVVWHKPRLERLFDFDYRIEMFVSRKKRRWGYYVLPFLLGNRLVARVDLKADRDGGRLLVLASYVESHADAGAVAGPLTSELSSLAEWLRLDSIHVEDQGDLADSLAGEREGP